MEIGVILATLLLLIVLYLLIRLALGPLKIVTRFLGHCVIALIVLVCFNFLGYYLGFRLPVNPVSVIGVGVLGVPGLLLVAFLNYLFI
ncbi:MAG TPA: SigmaK-factor processing regulatory BofA [Clostridia bacterium]|jgi:inhibitor of the pro-sigma K processing machinery|nr:SigmaK-factor processing regulatory BofA [Clostridia bacterium]